MREQAKGRFVSFVQKTWPRALKTMEFNSRIIFQIPSSSSSLSTSGFHATRGDAAGIDAGAASATVSVSSIIGAIGCVVVVVAFVLLVAAAK
jgi:hypothetical protein